MAEFKYTAPKGWIIYKTELVIKGHEADFLDPSGEVPKIGDQVIVIVKEEPTERTVGGQTKLRHQVDAIWFRGSAKLKQYTEGFWTTDLFKKNITIPPKPKFNIGIAVALGFLGLFLLKKIF